MIETVISRTDSFSEDMIAESNAPKARWLKKLSLDSREMAKWAHGRPTWRHLLKSAEICKITENIKANFDTQSFM